MGQCLVRRLQVKVFGWCSSPALHWVACSWLLCGAYGVWNGLIRSTLEKWMTNMNNLGLCLQQSIGFVTAQTVYARVNEPWYRNCRSMQIDQRAYSDRVVSVFVRL